ncbi:serine hydrolase domain-containing protein [Actinoplanes couchii]|uniref:Serine hydrolase n=1 Tax=Actinoplanes couchii TaxID=403638 RepID=A0ABQ3XQW2_9ACTN|nr:serine hydrolase domain-containing protein [Actinoplanes couchii]MDR6317484.1 D-alanyl-D-alanine carboxypeptidase [Actinoplanes couchii]GID60787.1 serine hydrolase [Actinoplanes couchii]
MRILSSAAAAVLLVLLSAAPAGAATSGELRRDVEALRATGVPGVLARFEDRGGVRVVRSGRGVPHDPYLRIGSTTKTFTAVVVLQLVGERRLTLDDPVEKWLPGAVGGRAITVRQLLQHTSGMYEYSADLIPGYATPESYRRERDRAYTPEQLVAIALRHPQGDTTWSYSNTNYVLAGMLIEAVTGRSWAREVDTRVLGPLGMRHTRTGFVRDLPSPHATNYMQFTPGGPLVDTTIAVRGLDSGADGSMVSTASDLHRFLGALAGGRLLRPAQQRQMRTLVAMPDAPGGAGLGLFRHPLSCGGGYWQHGGTGFGYQVEPAFTDDGRRLTVSLFANTGDPELAVTRQRLVRDLIDHAFCRR